MLRPSSSPRPFAVPLGDHIFATLAHLHSVMERGWVERAVGTTVVPAHELPDLGAEQLVDHLEARGAAGFDFVEVDHESPGALAGDRAVFREVLAARLEIIGVRLEFLPPVIALALDWLAVRGSDAVELEEALLEFP